MTTDGRIIMMGTPFSLYWGALYPEADQGSCHWGLLWLVKTFAFCISNSHGWNYLFWLWLILSSPRALFTVSTLLPGWAVASQVWEIGKTRKSLTEKAQMLTILSFARERTSEAIYVTLVVANTAVNNTRCWEMLASELNSHCLLTRAFGNSCQGLVRSCHLVFLHWRKDWLGSS